ncbi:MAG: hypothetical protein A2096_16415 [Spirochaetes bacterium GWF1_41_5]|nr:MAG: hypothetical protein A2096_16415 [Spirochaetes bacterium GWF1_41_5]HBE01373.1 hypothetical protein [Spirochaetia bacterium]
MTNLFSIHKQQYIKNHRSGDTDRCLLCALLAREPGTEDLSVFSDQIAEICVNLYPYNSGHLMIFPKRHIEQFEDFTEAEYLHIFRLSRMAIAVLKKNYNPSGFNTGFNIGEHSGASIRHLHLHIIPRYPNELGVIDIIGGAKILVEDPLLTMQKLKKAFGSPENAAEVL